MDYSRYTRAAAHMWALTGLWLLMLLSELGLLVLRGDSPLSAKLQIVYFVLAFGYAVVLLTLRVWNGRYSPAAACALAAVLMGVCLEFPDAFSARTTAALNIASYFLGALAECLECTTHSRVFAFINHRVRLAWSRIWTWYIWTLAVVLLAAVLGSAAPVLESISGAALLVQRGGKLCVLAASAHELGQHRSS